MLGDSANFYTDTSIAKIRGRNKTAPFYLHLTYQSVHGPFEEPPVWEQVGLQTLLWRCIHRIFSSEAKAGVSLLRQIPNNTAHLWWDHTWGSMLNSLDKGIGNVTAALRAENMWDSTVLLLTADNGGDCGFSAFLEPAVENNLANRARANNYPLRGRKCTPW